MKKNGQVTLILVMVTVVAALGVAVASSSQSKINLKETIFTTQSDQTLSCAEAGIERALANTNLNDTPLATPIGFTEATESCDNYTVNISNYPVSSPDTLEIPSITENTVQQLNIGNDGITGFDAGDTIALQFRSTNDDGTNPLDSVIAVYQYTSTGVERRLIFCDSSSDSTVNNLLSGVDYEIATYSVVEGICTYTAYMILGPDTPDRVLRIRPLYSDVRFVIEAFEGYAGYFISSNAKTGSVTRDIEAYVFYSQLPAGFDEALVSFSSTAILE